MMLNIDRVTLANCYGTSLNKNNIVIHIKYILFTYLKKHIV